MPGPSHRKAKRTTSASVLVLALAVAGVGIPALTAVTTSPALASNSESAPTVDPSNPTTGISDPVAGLPVMNRDCRSGQIDVNVAKPDAIMKQLAVPKSTAQLVVKGRPWQRSIDLISVPGIGPEKMSMLATKACATPTTLPVATPLACELGTGAVDLQSASQPAIVAKTGLDPAVVARLVGARPLPQDLLQVAAPRVPGFSDPTISMLVSAGKVCVTPAPFNFSGTTWRWASAAGGTVVEATGQPDYALIVPPGVVDESTGAWGKITPDLTSTLPKADSHIFGDWQGTVAVRLPDPAPSGEEPAILHESGGAGSVSWGTGLLRRDGTVTAFQTSLSDSIAFIQSTLCRENNAKLGSLYCSGKPASDVPLFDLANSRITDINDRVRQHPEGGPCGTVGLARSWGKLPVGLGCATDVDGATAKYAIHNNTGSDLFNLGVFTSFGSVMKQDPKGNDAYSRGNATVEPGVYGAIGTQFARGLANRGTLLAGTSIRVDKTQGSGPSTFQHHVPLDPRQFAYYWALFNAFDTIDAGLTILEGPDDLGRIGLAGCLYDFLDGSRDWGTAVDCVTAGIDNYLGELENDAKRLGNSARAKSVASARLGLSKITLVIPGLNLVSSAIVQLTSIVPRDLTVEYLRPAPPTHGGGTGGPGGEPGGYPDLVGDGSFIARTAGGEGFLVEPLTASAHEIENGGDFNCYASNRLVWDYVQKFRAGEDDYLNLAEPVIIEGGYAPSCVPPTPPRAIWTFGEQPSGNTPNNVILRGVPGPSLTSSWYINGLGEIDTIAEPRVYVCLAAFTPVLWNAPFSSIQAWEKVGSAPAQCGLPEY